MDSSSQDSLTGYASVCTANVITPALNNTATGNVFDLTYEQHIFHFNRDLRITLTMSNLFLPIEILEAIIEDLSSEYKDEGPSRLKPTELLPRWYLIPLLRVCKP